MQVLVPTIDVALNAGLYHERLLEQQRYDVMQVVKALDDPDNRHFSHPVVRQWRSHNGFLLDLGITLCTEWQAKGRVDHLLRKMLELRGSVAPESCYEPSWWRDPDLHSAHQAYLVRKWPNRYKQHFPDVDSRLPMAYFGPENDQAAALKEVERAKRARERAEAAEQEALRRAEGLDDGD